MVAAASGVAGLVLSVASPVDSNAAAITVNATTMIANSPVNRERQ